MKYFTSDWHLGHENVIEYGNRPFANVQHMNETIINNMYNALQPGDDLYVIGDLAWSPEDAELVFPIIDKGVNFYFILGDNDNLWMSSEATSRFTNVSFIETVRYSYGQHMVLFHYPLYTWCKSHFNSWLAYGHIHQDISHMVTGKAINVCVELHNYMPVSFEYIAEYMKTRPDNWDLGLLKREPE